MKNTNTSTAKLNEIAALFQNEGKQVTKEFIFDIVIKEMVRQGKTVQEAVEILFGSGSFEKFVEICKS